MDVTQRVERELSLLVHIALGSFGMVAFWWRYSTYSGLATHAVLAWIFWVCTNALVFLWFAKHSEHHRPTSLVQPIVVLWLSLLTGWAVYMALSASDGAADLGLLVVCLGMFFAPTVVVVLVGYRRRWRWVHSRQD